MGLLLFWQAASGPQEYIDAATVTGVAVPSAQEQFGDFPFYVSRGPLVDISGATDPIPVEYPSGIQPDDIIVMVMLGNEAQIDFSTVSGFTQVRTRAFDSTGTFDVSGAWYWRRATGSETGTVEVEYTVNEGVPDPIAGVMFLIRNVDPAGNPINVETFDEMDSDTPTAPAVTTTLDNTLAMALFLHVQSDETSNYTAGWTERFDLLSAVSVGCRIALATKDHDTIGSTGSVSASYAGSETAWLMFTAAVEAIPAAGQSAALTVATTTDSAQALGETKAKSLGLPTETDAAQAISEAKRRTLTVGGETDAAQALGEAKTRALAVVTETDAARSIPQVRALATTAETDSAGALVEAKTKGLAPSAETNAAQSLTEAKAQVISPGSEVDTTQAAGESKAVALTASVEIDAAGVTLRAGQAVQVTVTTEADSASSLQEHKSVSLASSTETDASQALAESKAKTTNPATETDAAPSFARMHVRAFGLANEVDSAQTVAGMHVRALSPSVEIDMARQIVAPARMEVVTEADVAQVLETARLLALAAALEDDAALALERALTLSPALEFDLALGIFPPFVPGEEDRHAFTARGRPLLPLAQIAGQVYTDHRRQYLRIGRGIYTQV